MGSLASAVDLRIPELAAESHSLLLLRSLFEHMTLIFGIGWLTLDFKFKLCISSFLLLFYRAFSTMILLSSVYTLTKSPFPIPKAIAKELGRTIEKDDSPTSP